MVYLCYRLGMLELQLCEFSIGFQSFACYRLGMLELQPEIRIHYGSSRFTLSLGHVGVATQARIDAAATERRVIAWACWSCNLTIDRAPISQLLCYRLGMLELQRVTPKAVEGVMRVIAWACWSCNLPSPPRVNRLCFRVIAWACWSCNDVRLRYA